MLEALFIDPYLCNVIRIEMEGDPELLRQLLRGEEVDSCVVWEVEDGYPRPASEIREVPLVFGTPLRLLRGMVRTMVGTELLAPRLVDSANPEPLAEFVGTLAWQLFLLVFLLMIVFAHRLPFFSHRSFDIFATAVSWTRALLSRRFFVLAPAEKG